MRILTGLLANAALLLAFLQAPSSHVHPHEGIKQHAGSFLHTHFGHVKARQGTLPEWRDYDPDDDFQFLSWVPSGPNDSGLAPVILTLSPVTIPTLGASERRTRAFRPSAHDPPSLKASSPRAPPAA